MIAKPQGNERQGTPSNKAKEQETGRKSITVAVAGNPNSGQSTLVNAIAGTRLHVGNWTGVTVERREAELEYRGMEIKLLDLPGTYSLSPYSQEEKLAKEYLCATRTLENPKDKALTALLIPLMSCGARLPVYVLFAGRSSPTTQGR